MTIKTALLDIGEDDQQNGTTRHEAKNLASEMDKLETALMSVYGTSYLRAITRPVFEVRRVRSPKSRRVATTSVGSVSFLGSATVFVFFVVFLASLFGFWCRFFKNRVFWFGFCSFCKLIAVFHNYRVL